MPTGYGRVSGVQSELDHTASSSSTPQESGEKNKGPESYDPCRLNERSARPGENACNPKGSRGLRIMRSQPTQATQ